MKIDLKEHMKTHMSFESRKKFACSVCGALLLSLKALQNHEQVLHSGVIEEHACDCGKIFSSKARLYQHRSKDHNETFPCNLCFRVYRNRDTLNNHTKKMHVTKIPCDVSFLLNYLSKMTMFISRLVKRCLHH